MFHSCFYYGDFIIFLHASKCKQQSEIFHYFLLHGAAVARNEKLISCLVIQRNVCGKKFFPNRRKYSFPTLLRTVGNSIFSPILQTFLYCFCCCAALSFFALVCLEEILLLACLAMLLPSEAAATASEGWVAGLMVDEANFSKAELTTVNLSFE